jgi:hypothetical protein
MLEPEISCFSGYKMIIAGYEYTDKNHLQMYIGLD